MNRAQRRQSRRHRRHPSKYRSSRLIDMLVADALDGVATPLPWAVAAYAEIGRQTGKGPEWAFTHVRDEVHALGGFMPDGEAWMSPGGPFS